MVRHTHPPGQIPPSCSPKRLDYVSSMIDDHSRLASGEILPELPPVSRAPT